jgi:hypothetical protein
MLIAVCGSVSWGAFDYTISNTYDLVGTNLNSQTLLVTGSGSIQIMAKGESYIEVQNTAPLEQFKGGIYLLGLDDFSTMNFYDGEMGDFNIYDDAEVTFSGGRIDYISSYQDSDIKKHITFICDVDSVNLTGNLLTGDWLDGSSFSITLQNQSGYDSVYSNIQFIPEPATLSLLGLGGLLIRRKFK